MTPLKIGIDVDGVLADFNTSFIARVKAITGRDLFGPDYVPTTWNYPESVGYTTEEVSRVWTDIKADPFFWSGLPAYGHTRETLRYLALCQLRGDDLYFITARPGIIAKAQTEQWISHQMKLAMISPPAPTVLISSAKGLCALALKLDIYVDDRVENVLDVWKQGAVTDVWLFDQPWNRGVEGLKTSRTSSVTGAIDYSRNQLFDAGKACAS